MNTYDFDKTIFYPDSSYSFIKWCLKRRPSLYLFWLPAAAAAGIGYLVGLNSKEHLKEKAFGFLPHLKDIDSEVELFWKEHEHKLSDWYLKQKKDDDLIISASPEFLLKPITDKLGVKLLATKMDKHSGKIHGLNCFGHEKVRRFREAFPDSATEEFYSDSLSDSPMAEIADKAYIIKDNATRPEEWPDRKEK